MFVSALAAVSYTAIVTMAGVIIGIFAAWMTDRKTKTKKCCANCARYKSCTITCNGEPVQPDNCCENWEGWNEP